MHAIVHGTDIQDRDGGAMHDRHTVWRFSVPSHVLRRRWLSRSRVSGGDEAHDGAGKRRNRQTLGWRQSVRRLAKALARRKNLRMAQSMSPIGEGLGVSSVERPSHPAPRPNPAHAAKAMHSNIMFADRFFKCSLSESLPLSSCRVDSEQHFLEAHNLNTRCGFPASFKNVAQLTEDLRHYLS
jgi:hypothetical protein